MLNDCTRRIFKIILGISMLLGMIAACSVEYPDSEKVEPLVIPTLETPSFHNPEAAIPKLIEDLSSNNAVIRVNAAYALASLGSDAEPAIPALIENLSYHEVYDVREAAAEALGEIGPAAKSAGPELVVLLQTDFVHVRRSAARALGQIGFVSAVPALAESLYDSDNHTKIEAAKALGALTGQDFPELHSTGSTLDDSGEPIIVIAARNWWQAEGQFRDWSTPLRE